MPREASEKQEVWEWTLKRSEAAEMVALGSTLDKDVAKAVGVSAYTLRNWKAIPQFTERIEEIRARLRAEAQEQRARVRETGFAVIEERVRRKNARLEQLEEVRLSRAAAAQSDLAWLLMGGSTGLVMRQEKVVGSGLAARLVVEYPLDSELIKTELALDRSIADDLGQHIQRQEVSGGTQGGPVQVVVEYAAASPRPADGDE